MEEQDPFQFILEVSEISPSQESLLPVSGFPGESVNAGDKEPPCSSVFPAEDQAGLLMFSMPETQDAAGRVAAGGGGTQEQEDVFHTPPEKSSAPSSGHWAPLDHCEINRELDARDEESLGFVVFGDSQGTGWVNLHKDSELGFSDVKPSQEVEGKLVAQSPRGIKRDAVAEELEGCERESCISELQKKSKLSQPNLGFDSSRACLGIESHELEEDNGYCKVGADVEPEKVDLAAEQVSGDSGISVQENLGSCPEIEAKEKKIFVFDVLKFLAENSPDDNEDGNGGGDDDGGGENASLEDAVKICGIDFPRPRWWSDTDLFRKQRDAMKI